MKEGTFFERFAENWLEGSFNRLLKPKLQPVQIAKAVVREMERGQMVGADGPLACNLYEVYLHPDDLANLAPFQAGLERELASFLSSRASQHRVRFLAPPRVRLVPEDQQPRRGRLRVQASMVDVPPPEATPASSEGGAWGGTVEMPAVTGSMGGSPLAWDPIQEVLAATLVDGKGQAFPLGKGETNLGRSIDNDLVIDDPEVSRYHARIVLESNHYVLLDLSSTNGSFVDGQKVARHILSEGEKLSFGRADFTFRLTKPQHPLSKEPPS